MRQILKALALAGISILIISGYSAAAQNSNIYKGELTSGSAKIGSLGSNELWLLYGEKGSRIVISTVVDKGNAPPEIYLYPQGGSKYEMHSDAVSQRYQVLDYKLDSAGKYVVLIHPCGPAEEARYQVAYTTLAPGDSYTIQPDAPDGNLIRENSPDKPGTSKIIMDRSGGIVPGSILLNLVTFGVGPIVFTALEGLSVAFTGAVDLNNRVEVASRAIEEPAGQCSIMIASVGTQ